MQALEHVENALELAVMEDLTPYKRARIVRELAQAKEQLQAYLDRQNRSGEGDGTTATGVEN